MALWDGPRQREAYDWFTIELANLRTAFRWAADQGDLDVAAPIATYAAWLGMWTENYEPIAWAEELIEPARAGSHPRLAFCMRWRRCARWPDGSMRLFATPRPARSVIGSGRDERAVRRRVFLGSAYLPSASPNGGRWCRAQLARGRDTHASTTASLVIALAVAGSAEEAMAAANGLIDAAEATGNPFCAFVGATRLRLASATPILSARSRPCDAVW